MGETVKKTSALTDELTIPAPALSPTSQRLQRRRWTAAGNKEGREKAGEETGGWGWGWHWQGQEEEEGGLVEDQANFYPPKRNWGGKTLF